MNRSVRLISPHASVASHAPILVLTAALALLGAAACGGGGGDAAKGGSSARTTPASPPSGSSATSAYDPAAPSGAVHGRVTFAGEPPAAKVVKMNADPYCDQSNPGGAKISPVEVSAGGGVAGTLVRISSGLPELVYPSPAGVVVLDQVACNYRPRVVALRVGQALEIRNSDATLHNVHAMPKESPGFNLGMPIEGMKATRKFSEPEVFVRFKCDVHPWMRANVAVLDHPFFVLTDGEGRYRIDGIPPGKYELEAVHPVLGSRTQTIEIVADGADEPDKDAEAVFGFGG